MSELKLRIPRYPRKNGQKIQALALRSVADKVIALAIRGDDHAARKVKQYLRTDVAFEKTMNTLAQRFVFISIYEQDIKIEMEVSLEF